MAKKPEPLNLADLNIALSSSKLGMSAAIAEQLKAAMGEPAGNAEPEKSNVSLDDKSIDKLNANIILLAGAIERNTKVLQKRSESKSNGSLSSNDLSENQIEAQRVQDYQTKLLEKIEENTRGGGGGGKDDTPDKSDGFSIGQIGLFGTLIAAALGTIAGVLTAYAKVFVSAVKGVYKGIQFIGEMFLKIIPESIKGLGPKIVAAFKNNVDILIINIEHAFGTAIELFKNRFPKAFSFVEESIKTFTTFFAKAFESSKSGILKLGEIFTGIKTAVSNFFKPIVEAFSVIKTESSFIGGIVSKVMGTFQSIGGFFGKIVSWMGSFAKVFKAFFVIGEKLALPVTVIMGLYEGISDAIDEFKKSGDIISTMGAFVKGALHSAVGSLLDLVKDLISWVFDKLGFDEVSKMLDSFSFNSVIDAVIDTMTDFWHAVFSPIETIKKIFTGITEWMSNLEIPAFSIFGKEFGPWKPLSGLVGENKKESKTEGAKAPMTNIGQAQNTESHVEKQADGKLKYFVNGKEVDSKTYQDNYNKNNAEMGNAVPLSVVPSKQSKYADQMYGKSAQVAAGNKSQPQQKASTVISAPTQVNNSTQNASFKTPVRNQDNTVNSYLKSRYVA